MLLLQGSHLLVEVCPQALQRRLSLRVHFLDLRLQLGSLRLLLLSLCLLCLFHRTDLLQRIVPLLLSLDKLLPDRLQERNGLRPLLFFFLRMIRRFVKLALQAVDLRLACGRFLLDLGCRTLRSVQELLSLLQLAFELVNLVRQGLRFQTMDVPKLLQTLVLTCELRSSYGTQQKDGYTYESACR